MSVTLPRSASMSRGATGRRYRRPDRTRSRVAAWTAVTVIGLFGMLPVYWLVATAFTPDDRAFSFPPSLIPTEITFDHFTRLAENEHLFRYLVNSVIVSVVTAALSVVVSAYMAYAFSKFRYRGRRSLMHLVLASQMFPQAVLLITLYAVFSATGLLGGYTALVLSFTTFTLPLCVWMLKGIFDTVPDSLMEAASIDGASRWRTLHTVVLPLAGPGMVAAGLFAFVRAWNDFIFALTLTDPERQTLPPGLVHTYLGEFQTAWPDLMAASLVVSLPVVAAFMFLQRYLVGGLTAGAVKG
ncbi:multiple sugar transport system permease protein [Streptosporangium becharense]|uniref:Multiple sugar transport system permease protein n=1 Tax=Streptosporangium becharense TaxID=1816182 RepID=A0A7W9MJL0_9ACTN|nr:carbohydrate ABC transporter permease [Streptosporangium becharense]MBB2915137.1 multiple sugar transport system permease protein [Streptosporangium becharense]MBB5822791.1 multiple sugar transport system permease protein [Streptosporangium becharense]